jgi:hypothetical protein
MGTKIDVTDQVMARAVTYSFARKPHLLLCKKPTDKLRQSSTIALLVALPLAAQIELGTAEECPVGVGRTTDPDKGSNRITQPRARIPILKDSSPSLNFAAVFPRPRYGFVDFTAEPVTRDGVVMHSLRQL